MKLLASGPIRKMKTALDNGQVQYSLPVGDSLVAMNELIGQTVNIHFLNEIRCQHCDRKTKKSYSQGYCFPCMQSLARCDMCIMKPETCHFEKGTCREPEWGQENCMIPHYVYLANTSGLKVGITRHSQIPTRWCDQGATQALPIFKVASRIQSGLVETALAEFIADKTNWRAMLKGNNEAIDLKAKASELIPLIAERLSQLKLTYGSDAIEQLDEDIIDLDFPVTEFPTKITSFNLDKAPIVSGVLQGIKGQYLLLDTGVINMRKFTSYFVDFSVESSTNQQQTLQI
ncbi:DUF2797 domain-containing protein [Thalassotalea agarivorans]|uniref:DUF2797 domain-containing protein n=1 Tax=Thalassotalea agarivorans TaxID=349064 RepID=A0A1H9YBK7_THASX|nr:DUF2797 domain-containing protein [Thalassotalea agarivorans]SES66371.1 Protein of unknown function [Thalassotalea agarivorans]